VTLYDQDQDPPWDDDEECPYCNGDGTVFDVVLHEERPCSCTRNDEEER